MVAKSPNEDKNKQNKTASTSSSSSPPQPKYSFYKRKLPKSLVALSSSEGKSYLISSLSKNAATSYFPLTEQFLTQSDPSFCGVTTLAMILNALLIDPNSQWKGIWRWFLNEESLLEGCCLSKETILNRGITLEQFVQLGRCKGAHVTMKRPNLYSLHEFRTDIELNLCKVEPDTFVAVSFDRSRLDQTGSGHYSPIAAFHNESDSVLILDVARFKYTPYWVSIEKLYYSMCALDRDTNRMRGWFILSKSSHCCTYQEYAVEKKLEVTKLIQPCPIEQIKISYCSANKQKSTRSGKREGF